MARALPTGIDRLPSGSYRVRVNKPGQGQRTLGTFGTLEAAVTARLQALGAVMDVTGRTSRSQASWVRTTAARLRLVDDPDDRELITALLDVLERQATRRATTAVHT